jgi:hypothetical protein
MGEERDWDEHDEYGRDMELQTSPDDDDRDYIPPKNPKTSPDAVKSTRSVSLLRIGKLPAPIRVSKKQTNVAGRRVHVDDRGDKLKPEDMKKPLHMRLAIHRFGQPMEDLKHIYVGLSPRDLRSLKDLVSSTIRYKGTSRYTIDAVAAKFAMVTTPTSPYLKPSDKVQNIVRFRNLPETGQRLTDE